MSNRILDTFIGISVGLGINSAYRNCVNREPNKKNRTIYIMLIAEKQVIGADSSTDSDLDLIVKHLKKSFEPIIFK